MKNVMGTMFAASAVFLMFSNPVSAHHGTATYDLTMTIPLNGSG